MLVVFTYWSCFIQKYITFHNISEVVHIPSYYLFIIRPFLGREREFFLHCGNILSSEDKRLQLRQFVMPVTISVMAFPALFLYRPDLERPDLLQGNGFMFKLFYLTIWDMCYRRLYSRNHSIQQRRRLSRNCESVVVAQAEMALQPKNSTRHNASCPERPPQQMEPKPWAKWSQWTFTDI